MKIIGLIKEIYKRDDLPSVKDLIEECELEDKAYILRYLQSCPVIAVAPGRVVDAITGGPIKGELKMHSDGEYAWRSDVIYYFERYNLKLDDAFLAKIRGKAQLFPNNEAEE